MVRKIRVGIIGCGGIAFGKHMPAAQKIDGVEMVAFCDIIEERAEKAAAAYGAAGAKVYTDYRKLLKDVSIEAVYVLTPNRSHAQISIDAMQAGKHVMCEKPLAKNYADAKRMVETSRATGKILTVGYQNRQKPESRYLKAACERGDLGEIYFAKAQAVRRRAVPTWGVFLNEEEQGGGSLIDIGTHALDLTLWMMNNYRPKAVTGTVYKKLAECGNMGNDWGDWDPEKFTVEDSAFGFITMEDGSTIILETSWALNTLDVGEGRTQLCGTRAGADMRDGLRINTADFGHLVTIKPDMTSKGAAYYDGISADPEILEQRAFYDAILFGKELVVKPEQALVVTQILEAIYMSASLGRQVEISELK